MISFAVSLLPLVEDDAVNWFGWVEFEKANKAGNLTPLTPLSSSTKWVPRRLGFLVVFRLISGWFLIY